MCLEDSCIEIVLDETKNFADAVDYCNMRGGRLLEIRNEMARIQSKNIAIGKLRTLIM